MGGFAAVLLFEVAYVAFAWLGASWALRELGRAAGLDLTSGRTFGLVPGRVRVDELSIETTSGPRVSLSWRSAHLRLSLLELARGRLVVTRFSGGGLTVRAAPVAETRSSTGEPGAVRASPPALSAAHASSAPVPGVRSLGIANLVSGVDRLDIGPYELAGKMTLNADGIVLGGGELRARDVVLVAESVVVRRGAVRLAEEVTGRVSLADTRVSVRGGRAPEGRAKVTLRARQPSFAAFPELDGLSLAGGALATAELEVDRAGVSGAARLSSPAGARWVGLAGTTVWSSERVELAASRGIAGEPIQVELSSPRLRTACQSTSFCVEEIERLLLNVSVPAEGSWESSRRELRLHCGRSRLRIAGRTFASHSAAGSGTFSRAENGGPLRLRHGTLSSKRVDWLTSDGRSHPLADSARLVIEEATVSRGKGRLRGRLEVRGSDAGALVELAALPWLRPPFAGIAGSAYTAAGSVRLGPNRFALEDARVSAAGLALRGTLRSNGDERAGAFLFRYGSWTLGALIDEGGVHKRFGVGERWLARESAALP